MKKTLGFLMAVTMVIGLFAGCASKPSAAPEALQDTPAVTESAAEDMTFVIVPKCVHAWFDEVNKGAVLQANKLSEQLGVEISIDYRAPQSADVVAQNAVLEQAAATHPAGIAIDPVDYEGSKAVIEEIQGRGIPVVLFDAPAPEGSNLTSVGNDFKEQASIAADKLASLIGEKGKVAVMQGFPSAPNHAERYQAHLDTLAKYPDITVIDGGIDNDNIETAQSQAAAVMAANPDLVGFLNCDACGTGVAAAIEEAGKTDQIKFVSMDNLIEILNYVKKGTITATSSTIPQMQGSMAVLMLWQQAIGIEIPKVVDTGIAYIDQSNIDEWIELVNG